MNNPKVEYDKLKNYYEEAYKKQVKAISSLGNLRLGVFVVAVTVIAYMYFEKKFPLMFVFFGIFIVTFVWLVIKHGKLRTEKVYISTLLEINNIGLRRLCGDWKSFKDNGEDFIDGKHNYSYDLDIFGKGSLFQFINSAYTYLGRQKLKNALSDPLKSVNDIRERQEAISELAVNLEWRQKFMTEGSLVVDKMLNPEELMKWAETPNEMYSKTWFKYLVRIFSIATFVVILLFLFTDSVPYFWALLMILIQVTSLFYKSSERGQILRTVYNYNSDIKMYKNMLTMFENTKFESTYLNKMKKSIHKDEAHAHTAYHQIGKLQKIVDLISNKSGSMYFLINILTLSDYHFAIALEGWRMETGNLLRNWIEVTGEIEALCSLSNINYEQQDWVIPEIVEGKPYYKANTMGHPLLATRVCNDIAFGEDPRILLITGSNMSGKSTWLRTIGINLVLAYAGAPVCAKEFTCTIMNLYSCMRTSDDLTNNISSFYAELLKIKEIVTAVDNKEKILFMLDEIFKGTNSMDRHTGAKVLIQKLLGQGAIGLVSTHDLELSILEDESNGKVRNYHFKEFYENKEIRFDYILRSGVSKTRNALHLIKMVGIDIEE